MPNPPIHVLSYGDFGSGKSTFAATFPKPMIVFTFDAFSKETPYLKGGDLSELYDDGGILYRDVTSRKTGKLLKRVEYYHDTRFIDPIEIVRKAGKSIQAVVPDAYARFLKRMSRFHDEYGSWATAVVDSVTSMEIAARRWDQYVINPRAEDGRQWYGASKDMLEQMLLGRFASMPINVVVCAHIDDEKFEHHGRQRRMPMAPGKLRGSLPSQYGEVYHQYIAADGEYLLQTHGDENWSATSAIGAPNPCTPHYNALWADVGAAQAP